MNLVLGPTIAMREGKQHAAQCGWCGAVVVSPKRSQDLQACPACGRSTWWRQILPVAGLKEVES